jgi:hypothetical protein
VAEPERDLLLHETEHILADYLKLLPTIESSTVTQR